MNDRMNTIFGWVLASGIVALGGSIVSGMYFHTEAPEEPGYVIEAPEEGAAEEAGPSLAVLLASGSAEAGEGVFAKCVACHTIAQGGATGIGPNLFGVLGTSIGSHAPGFAYSDALAGHGGNWDYEAMDAWLANPAAFAAGTKMTFAGLSNPEERANVILYLMENGGGPALPEPEVEEPAEEGGEDAATEEGAEDAAAEDAASAEEAAAE